MYLILLASFASAGDSVKAEALMKRAPVAKSVTEPKSINSFLPPDQAFVISTNCKGVDEAFCSGAKYLDLIRTAVKSASMLLAKEILIRKPINVHVFFEAEMPVEAMGTSNPQPFRNFDLPSCEKVE